jgi:hypothetical protein
MLQECIVAERSGEGGEAGAGCPDHQDTSLWGDREDEELEAGEGHHAMRLRHTTTVQKQQKSGGSKAKLPGVQQLKPEAVGIKPSPPPLTSSYYQTSSQKDTQTTLPSRLISGETAGGLSGSGGGERDDYLLRLLSRGRPPVGQRPSLPVTQDSSAFRAPEPVHRMSPAVPSQLAQLPLAGPSVLPPAGKAAPQAQQIAQVLQPPSPHKPLITQQQQQQQRPLPAKVSQLPGQPRRHSQPQRTASPSSSDFSFSGTRLRLGEEVAQSVRHTMLQQQITFLEQLYDLHRVIAVQVSTGPLVGCLGVCARFLWPRLSPCPCLLANALCPLAHMAHCARCRNFWCALAPTWARW